MFSIAASAADVAVRNRCLYIKGQRWFKYDDVEPNSIVKEAWTDEVLGKITWTTGATPPSTASVYTVGYTQLINGPGTLQTTQFRVSVNVPASSTTSAIALLFKAALAGNPLITTDVSTATFYVQGITGYPVVAQGVWIEEHSGTPSTVTQTTQGSPIVGSPTALAALGAPTLANPKYTAYYVPQFAYVGENNTMRVNQGATIVLLLNEASANCAALVTEIDLDLNAFSSGSTIDPEVSSVSGQ